MYSLELQSSCLLKLLNTIDNSNQLNLQKIAFDDVNVLVKFLRKMKDMQGKKDLSF